MLTLYFRSKRGHKKDLSDEKSIQELSSISTNTSANEAIISNLSNSGKLNVIDSSMQDRPRSITPTSFQSPIRTPRKMSYQTPMPPDLLCDTFYARKRRNTIEGNIDSPIVMIDILGNDQPSPSYEKVKSIEPSPNKQEPVISIPEITQFEMKTDQEIKPMSEAEDNENNKKDEVKPEKVKIEINEDKVSMREEEKLMVKNRAVNVKSNTMVDHLDDDKATKKIVERKSHSSERSSSRCENKPAIPQKPEKLVREAREARRTLDHQGKVPQTAEHSRRSSQKRITQTKERRSISAPRSRGDVHQFNDYRMRSNSKPNRVLFAQIKPLAKPGQSIHRSQFNFSCVSVHSLPGLESYSYRDDTLDDPLDELLNRRIEILSSDHLRNKITPADGLMHDGSNGDLKSSKSSFRHPDEDLSCESLDQWASDSQDFESDFGSVDISSVQNETLDRHSELNKMIIDSYLRAHFPDDLILDNLMDTSESKSNDNNPVKINNSNQLITFDEDLNQQLTVDKIVMQNNLQLFTCY